MTCPVPPNNTTEDLEFKFGVPNEFQYSAFLLFYISNCIEYVKILGLGDRLAYEYDPAT